MRRKINECAESFPILMPVLGLVILFGGYLIALVIIIIKGA